MGSKIQRIVWVSRITVKNDVLLLQIIKYKYINILSNMFSLVWNFFDESSHNIRDVSVSDEQSE